MIVRRTLRPVEKCPDFVPGTRRSDRYTLVASTR